MIVDGGLGSDSLRFHGTAGVDFFAISRETAGSSLQVVGLHPVSITNTFLSWNVFGGDGSDFFSINEPGAINQVDLNIEGGSGFNQVFYQTATGSVFYQPGTNRSGLIQSATTVGMANIDLASVNPLTPNATHVVSASDAANHINVAGQPGQIFVSVDDATAISFAGVEVTRLQVNGNSGDDSINVAPNGFAGTITVTGDSPTASDSLTIEGTIGADNVTVTPTGTDSATITGLSAKIVVATVEHLTYSGQGGDDSLTITATADNDTITVTQGSKFDNGSVSVNSLLPLVYQNLGTGATALLALADQGGLDRLIINGTNGNDNFAVGVTSPEIITYQSDVASKVGGTSHVRIAVPAAGQFIEGLLLNSLDGDDSFIINSSTLYSLGIAINAGGPSASDRVNINGANAVNDSYTLTLGAANDKLSGVVAGDVLLNGVEDLTISSGTGDDDLTVDGLGGQSGLRSVSFASNGDANDKITVNGTVNPDVFTIKPLNSISAQVSAGIGPVVTATLNAATGAFTVNGLDGNDTARVVATDASDKINIAKGATTTVEVFGNKTISIVSNKTENVTVDGGDGTDTFNVTGTAVAGQILNILGGAPTANDINASDVIVLGLATNGTTSVAPGATIDSGTILNPDGNIEYSGIDFFKISGAAGVNTLKIQGTHNNDTIALQRLASDGATFNRVWINDRAVFVFETFANVAINGLFGDDKINVHPAGLVGVTAVTVAGSDPTASDEVVINGTAILENIQVTPTGVDSATVTGLIVPVTIQTTELLKINGLGGDDTINISTPGTANTITVTPAVAPDAGSVRVDSLIPIEFSNTGAGGQLQFTDAGGNDTLLVNGTNASDVFRVPHPAIAAPSVALNNRIGVSTAGIETLTLRGLSGDDVFNVVAVAGVAIAIQGDDSANHSNTLNFTGVGASSLNLGAGTIDDAGVAGTPDVTYTGIDFVNVNAAGQPLTVQGTAGNDTVSVTPLGGNAGLINAGPTLPIVNYSAVLANTVQINLLAGQDTLAVYGTAQAETITVNAVTGTVNTGAFGGVVNFNGGLVEALSIYALQGSDRIDVTPGPVPVFVDGGDPIGLASGDTLSVTNAVGVWGGPENDEGGIFTIDQAVSFDHIEALVLAPIPGCPFLVVGTNSNDQITVIAIDDPTIAAGADGKQDYTVAVNSMPRIALVDVPDLYIDAMAGNDDIVIVGSAPNEADWDVNIRVAGGTPSIGGPGQSDRVVFQTPNKLGGFDDIVFNPTGADTGELINDVDNNGVYNAGGTDSIITIDSFVYNCPPAKFTYVSSLGGAELIQLDGQGAPAIDDNLTINGTVLDDLTVVSPAGIGRGVFTSDASPRFEFVSFDSLTINPGAGGYDQVILNGNASNELVTSNANQVFMGGSTITLGAVSELNINTFDGNDLVDLDLQIAGLKKVVDVGAGNDRVDLSDVLVDPADPVIFGGTGNDVLIGSPNPDEIYGGSGDDILIGGAGEDYQYGEDGNDIFGNATLNADGVADDAGIDHNFGGAGFDNFVWEPGDGADINNGGEDGADIFRFFGDANANTFTLRPGGTATHFNALFGAVTIDNHGIEDVVVSALGGADTITVADLFPTEVVSLNLNLGAADGAVDSVTMNGRALNDDLLISTPAANAIQVAGLRYNVNILSAETTDTLTVNGNDGDDRIAVGPGSNATIALTLNGGSGNDRLDASATNSAGAIVFSGGAGNDSIVGGFGDDQIFGNDGDDTFVGGQGADSIDGGTGVDTILVAGSDRADLININQIADNKLQHTVNGDVQIDTIALLAGVPTVENVYVDARSGADIIIVTWLDSLRDAVVNTLRVDVDGGIDAVNDRIAVLDNGVGDLILYQRGTNDAAGVITTGPANPEAMVVTFTNVEIAQPIAAADGDIVVFKHDPFEFNDARTLATYLGAGDAINVDPNINPPAAAGLPVDQDYYRVVAERTGVLDFQVYFRQIATVNSGRPGLPGAGDLDIQILDVAGNVIANFGNNDADDDERKRIPAVAGQTYYLRVFGVGNAINNYTFTVDNYEPPTPANIELLDNPVTVDPPPSNSDTGRSQLDNITRNPTPTLIFRLDDGIFINDLPGNNSPAALSDPPIQIPHVAGAVNVGYRVAIFDEGPLPNGSQPGTSPQTPLGFATRIATAGSEGVYSFVVPAALSNGSHFLTARVQMLDPAAAQQTGFGPRSQALEIVVDTIIPTVAFGTTASTTDGLQKDSDSGIATELGSFTDRITNDTTPTVYGVSEADAIVRLFLDLGPAGVSPEDILLGQTVARPIDGTSQGIGHWEITSNLGLNDPAIVAQLGKDGVRRLMVTSEDVAGNISLPDTLPIMLDTTPPVVSAVRYTDGTSVFQMKPTPSPTPAVNSMLITFTGGPASAGGFLLEAVNQGLVTNPKNYQLVGDHGGNVLISSAAIVGVPTADTVVVQLNFNEGLAERPLQDDRYTLYISDAISDIANNALDGDSQAQSPGGTVLPSGNGINGGRFAARFTVDSRPEVASISEGLVYVDINGNGSWDPTGEDNDRTNRDFVFQFGQLVDGLFAGNFAVAGVGPASGYDKLGSYGRFGGVYSFFLDTDDDGVGDFTSFMPAAYQVNGMPVAGDFAPAHPGDEIGLFDGTYWYLDTNGNMTIDPTERIRANYNGLPMVGNFDNVPGDELAVYNSATNMIVFDTDRDGNANFFWNVADDINRFGGLSGFTDRPVVGDLNLDGVDDIGIWVMDRQGTTAQSNAEYFFWVSDTPSANPANTYDAFSPSPLGNDLFYQFGDSQGLPIFGNFDPPVGNPVDSSNPLHRTNNPLDVNGDGFVSALDALLTINVLNTFPSLPSNSPVRTFATIGQITADANNDGTVSALDALLVINELNNPGASEAEGEAAFANTDATFAQYAEEADTFFADLDFANDATGTKKKR